MAWSGADRVPTGTAPLRLSPLDRRWLGLRSVRAVGPLDAPGVEEVRAAFATLAARRPGHRLLHRLDAPAGRWVPRAAEALAGDLDRIVQPLGGAIDDRRLAEGLTTWLGDPGAGDPLRVLVGSRHLVLDMAHALGDGAAANAVLDALARAGGAPDALAAVPTGRPLGLLGRALLSFYGARPDRLHATLTCDRPRPPGPGPGAARVRCPPGTGPRTFRFRASRPGLVADLAAAGKPSGTARLVAAAMRAFAAAPFPVERHGLHLAVDARRYLAHPDRHRYGNFSISCYLRPTRPDDAVAVDAAIGDLVRSGRVLAGLARSAVLGPRAPGPGGAVLSISVVRALPGAEGWPWAAPPSARRALLATSASSPEGISLNACLLGGRVQVSCSFDGRRRSPAEVDAALLRLLAGLEPG
jgi:hypothetical protein